MQLCFWAGGEMYKRSYLSWIIKAIQSCLLYECRDVSGMESDDTEADDDTTEI